MEYGDASGSALMDVRTRTWSAEICHAIDPGLLAKLPPLHSSRAPAGALRPEWLKRWNLPGARDGKRGAAATT